MKIRVIPGLYTLYDLNVMYIYETITLKQEKEHTNFKL